MLEFYPQVKWVHVTAVLCSGTLFLLRGLLIRFGHAVPARHLAVRILHWTIDTTLLTAAFMLFTMLPSAVFGNGWLLMKLCLLVVYLILAAIALSPRTASRAGTFAFVLAIAVFGSMLLIARTHQPLGLR